jgi:hypothetical protein
MCLGANYNGDRIAGVVSRGLMFSWNLASNEVFRCSPDLSNTGMSFMGRASRSASTRPWSTASIAPDLSVVGYWSQTPDEKSQELVMLCVRRQADAVVVFEHAMKTSSILSAIVFHPTRPLVAILDDNKLTYLFDYARGQVVVEKGPQAHSLSFGLENTLVFDDWYGHTQSFDYVTLERRSLSKSWGSLASQSDRFLSTAPNRVELWQGSKPTMRRRIDFEQIIETVLSTDGTRVAVRADYVCVWDLSVKQRH